MTLSSEACTYFVNGDLHTRATTEGGVTTTTTYTYDKAGRLTQSKWGVAGPRYFKYKGEWLNNIRKRLGV